MKIVLNKDTESQIKEFIKKSLDSYCLDDIYGNLSLEDIKEMDNGFYFVVERYNVNSRRIVALKSMDDVFLIEDKRIYGYIDKFVNGNGGITLDIGLEPITPDVMENLVSEVLPDKLKGNLKVLGLYEYKNLNANSSTGEYRNRLLFFTCINMGRYFRNY